MYISAFIMCYVSLFLNALRALRCCGNATSQRAKCQLSTAGGPRVADNFTKKPEKKIKYLYLVHNILCKIHYILHGGMCLSAGRTLTFFFRFL